jgi:uncharacterized protein YndB with AHSA1/START domain
MLTKSKPATKTISISRVIHAPCEKVFRAWTDPKHLAQWFSPEDIECRSVEANPKVGGAFRIHMVSKKGDHIAVGKFTALVKNKRVQMTWEWESYRMPDSLLTIDLEDLGATTHLTLTHSGLPDAEDASGHKKGWTSALRKLARLMKQNKIK